MLKELLFYLGGPSLSIQTCQQGCGNRHFEHRISAPGGSVQPGWGWGWGEGAITQVFFSGRPIKWMVDGLGMEEPPQDVVMGTGDSFRHHPQEALRAHRQMIHVSGRNPRKMETRLLGRGP